MENGALMVAVWGLSALGVFQLAYLARRFAQRYGLLPSRQTYGKFAGPDLSDPSEQLRLVSEAVFQARPVMGLGEYRVFQAVEREAAACRQGFRVFAQTSLGEILQSKDKLAFRSINSKRADVLVVDRRGYPVIVVEYQGEGHYQGTGAMRDAVKREALRRAGVEQVEILKSYGPEEVAAAIRGALRRAIDARASRKPEAA